MNNGLAKHLPDTVVIIGHCIGVIPKIFARRVVVAATLLVVALAHRRGKPHRSLLVDISDKAAFLAAIRAVNLAPVAVLLQMKTVLTHRSSVLSVAHCTFALCPACSAALPSDESAIVQDAIAEVLR